MMFSTYKALTDASWALCGGANNRPESVEDPEERVQRERQTRELAAMSKSGQWGPTHSYESDEEVRGGTTKKGTWSGDWGWSSSGQSRAASAALTPPKAPAELKRSTGTDSTESSSSSPKAASPPPEIKKPTAPSSWGPWARCTQDTTVDSTIKSKNSNLMDYVEDVCSPCQPRNLSAAAAHLDSFPPNDDRPSLGICRLEPPGCGNTSVHSSSPRKTPSTGTPSVSSESPADRRRQRHRRRQLQRSPSPHEDFEVTPNQVLSVSPKGNLEPQSQVNSNNTSNSNGGDCKEAPVDSFTLDKSTAVELERCISELTMRSSYGVATAKISENRRMAYYAVGKLHRQSGRGGNRRCYFTGKLILGGAPFYAGSVQQGLRTLVVFCLPSSLGLPKGTENAQRDNGSVLAGLEGGSVARRFSGSKSIKGGTSILSRKGSRISKFDELSLSVGEEMDPNWGFDKDYLLSVLPNPNQALLDDMARRFPQQFETLPVQVRNPQCWRLYVKFCFFSGLPIAEGELHYKVRDAIADIFGEEVILSHEVMEAVNGQDSAEILRLPNLKTFRYLRKHYNQQSAKLPEEVFQRQSWEMIRPEV